MSIPVFIGITLLMFGSAGYMTGQAIALTWRPWYQMIPYSLLLGATDRFLIYALFDGELLSPTGYLIDTTVITVIGLLGFRIIRVNRMISQYPWLYQRSGLLNWKSIKE